MLKSLSSKIIVLLAFIIVGFGLFLVFNQAINNSNSLNKYKTGALSSLELPKSIEIAPNDAFIDENGNKIQFADFKGKVIVVNIWATWCGPCVKEMPSLANVAAQYKDKNISFIALNIEDEKNTKSAIAKLKELSQTQLKFYQDPTMSMAFTLRAKGFPTTIFYDETGKELARISGEVEWQQPEIKYFLDALLART